MLYSMQTTKNDTPKQPKCAKCQDWTGPEGGHTDGHDTCPVFGGRAATTTIYR